MKKIKKKAFAYITNYQQQLLVFRHPYVPEAGIQVPAGTVEENELPEKAALREAFEETGLTEFTLNGFLGEQRRDMADFGRDEIHERYFYHLQYHGKLISTWRHEELHRSNSEGLMPIVFEFFWVQLPDGVPLLIADHGAMLPQLYLHLFGESC